MKKLLIIDDEVDFCTLVKLQCAKSGIDCKYANTLAEGLELLSDFTPDMLILDNNLPDGYGWSHACYLLDHYPDLSLSLITAKNSYDKINDNLYLTDKRIACYLKPLTLGQLDNIIHSNIG